jgi:hypothetical protein
MGLFKAEHQVASQFPGNRPANVGSSVNAQEFTVANVPLFLRKFPPSATRNDGDAVHDLPKPMCPSPMIILGWAALTLCI